LPAASTTAPAIELRTDCAGRIAQKAKTAMIAFEKRNDTKPLSSAIFIEYSVVAVDALGGAYFWNSTFEIQIRLGPARYETELLWIRAAKMKSS
jgi:hypothetical protein